MAQALAAAVSESILARGYFGGQLAELKERFCLLREARGCSLKEAQSDLNRFTQLVTDGDWAAAGKLLS
jgi:hypothetical protein